MSLRDQVPARLRRTWVDQGACPGRDLYSLFDEHARTHPERAAVVDPEGVLTYAGLAHRVRVVASRFAASGLGFGDIIGIRLPNDRSAVITELAVAAIGAVSLPYPSGKGTRDTRSLLARSKARAAVLHNPEDVAAASVLSDVRVVFSPHPVLPGTEPLEPRQAAPGEWSPRRIDPESPARLLVSSGTESEPKMVAYSHNAFAGGRANYIRALHDGANPMRNLVLAPVASSFGSCAVPVTVAALGGTLLVLNRFEPEAVLRAITEHHPTHVFAVPTMLQRLAESEPRVDEDTSSVRAFVSSGAALPGATARACRTRFDRPVVTVYGSSDGINCHTARTGTSRESGTGRPDPSVCEIRITDEHDRALPTGQPGEIQGRGPMSPLCYVGAPELDSRYRTAEGWVRTGDRGALDESGRLHVFGRLGMVIVRGGYNISPAEVERELEEHQAVAEVACVAVPDPELGERVCACVRQAPGIREIAGSRESGVPGESEALTLHDLTRFLEGERGLERRKLPEFLLLVSEMPLGSTGKVCRTTLGRIAAERSEVTAAAGATLTAEPAIRGGSTARSPTSD